MAKEPTILRVTEVGHVRIDTAARLEWIKWLPEAGSEFYQPRMEKAAFIDSEIKRKVLELQALQRSADRLLQDAEGAALAQWTPEEIAKAKEAVADDALLGRHPPR